VNNLEVIEVKDALVKDELGNIYPVAPHLIIPLPDFWKVSSECETSKKLFEEFQEKMNKSFCDVLGIPPDMLKNKPHNYTETRAQARSGDEILESFREALAQVSIKFEPEKVKAFFKILNLEKQLKVANGKDKRGIRRRLRKLRR